VQGRVKAVCVLDQGTHTTIAMNSQGDGLWQNEYFEEARVAPVVHLRGANGVENVKELSNGDVAILFEKKPEDRFHTIRFAQAHAVLWIDYEVLPNPDGTPPDLGADRELDEA